MKELLHHELTLIEGGDPDFRACRLFLEIPVVFPQLFLANNILSYLHCIGDELMKIKLFD